ncbi:hypothetical protein Q8G50_30295, partial [Klebsiella pneumoniae]
LPNQTNPQNGRHIESAKSSNVAAAEDYLCEEDEEPFSFSFSFFLFLFHLPLPCANNYTR